MENALSESATFYWGVGSLTSVAAFTLWLLNRYTIIFPSKRRQNALDQQRKSHSSVPVIIITYIAWVFGFATIAVLPVDIAITNNNQSEDSYSQEMMHFFWVIFYWSSMLLSYIFIPWFMSYEQSGEFNTGERLKQSLLETLWFYIYVAGGGILFALVLWIKGSFSIKDSAGNASLMGFLMALGGAAGLLQIVVFLGYGLISVPRHVYFRSSNKSRFEVALCHVD